MGSWMTIEVEVNAADRRHADTQFGYVVEAVERLPFVENAWPKDDDYDYEDERV